MATCSGEQVMALSWGKDECLHVGEEIEWSVLLLSIVLLTRTSSLRTWIETLVLWRWATKVIQRLWEVVMFASKLVLGIHWLWRMCDMFLNCVFIYFHNHVGIMTITSVVEDVNWTRGHLWWLKSSLVALSTRHMWRCVEMYFMLWKNKSKLRYKRLTHINDKGFQILAKKSLILFSKGRMLNPCNHCFYNKQHNISFAISSQKKSNPFGLVTLMFVVLLRWSLWVAIYILSHLLMMHQGRCGECVELKKSSVSTISTISCHG